MSYDDPAMRRLLPNSNIGDGMMQKQEHETAITYFAALVVNSVLIVWTFKFPRVDAYATP